MFYSALAISVGAAIGALLRWMLGLTLNGLFPTIPPGTLVANLVGGYLMGVALAIFAATSWLAPEWRLFVMTGFLGGLTTFSAFSGELVMLILQGRIGVVAIAIGMHVAGTLLMTLLGLATVGWIGIGR